MLTIHATSGARNTSVYSFYAKTDLHNNDINMPLFDEIKLIIDLIMLFL